MDINDTIRNKNLLRVAMEIAAKGTREGNDEGFDDIEAINPSSKEVAVTETADDGVNELADLIIEELAEVESNLDFELVNEDLDFAIDQIINKLLGIEETVN
tara:strand:+ start:1390 stop:1695 length:306 start_codon:yes stop_codon:yes gene_type:complete